MSSYGLSEWGLSSYGGALSLYTQSAVAVTTHSVVVTLSTGAQAESVLATGDALNPRTWEVYKTGTTTYFTVVGVQKLNPRRYRLFLLQPLGSWRVSHTVNSSTLLSAGGFLISPPRSITFWGVETGERTLMEPAGPFDLATTDNLAGGLRTNEGGGYDRVYANDLIRKMVLRRFTTMPGAYFHIPETDFGADLKVKEPVRFSSAPAMKRRLEDEIRKEPGVVDCRVSLVTSTGAVSIKARVQTIYGTDEVAISAR